MTPEQIAEARKQMQAETQNRLQSAASAFEDLQKKYRVKLIAIPQITSDGRIVAVMQFVDAQE